MSEKDPVAVARGRASKARGKTYERDIARRLGGTRHKADSGGGEDVEHDWLCIQVKSGGNVMTQCIRDGLASARASAVGKTKLPCVVVVDRRTGRLGRYIVFELDAWAAWHGIEGQS